MDSDIRQIDIIAPAPFSARLKSGLLDFVIALILCIIPVLGVAYWLTKDALFEQGSFGKRRWNILVVDSATQNTIYKDWGRSFKRNIFTALPAINLLEWTLMVISGKGLGDRWANTMVIYKNEKPEII